jgi:alpha-tubulin suppressor-like RCC1 family protein
MGSADHTCALLATGAVDCWGGNEYGQLGDGNTTNTNGPVAVSGISTAIAITAGWQDTCALLSGGSVKCWGRDDLGQLGNGEQNETPHPTPVTVSGITTATAVTAGDFHTCARLSAGELKCWGVNDRGQLGNGRREVDLTPGFVTDFE